MSIKFYEFSLTWISDLSYIRPNNLYGHAACDNVWMNEWMNEWKEIYIARLKAYKMYA